MLHVPSMEGLGLAADTRELLMRRQRDPNAEDGTIVPVSAPTSPAPLHRRPRTDQRLLSAAPEALPLTEMHSFWALACVAVQAEMNCFSGRAMTVRQPPTDGWPASAMATATKRDSVGCRAFRLQQDDGRRHS